MIDIWDKTLDILKANVTGVTFTTWFTHITPVTVTDSLFLFKADTPMVEDVINKRYIETIQQALVSVTDTQFEVVVKYTIDPAFEDSVKNTNINLDNQNKKEYQKTRPQSEDSINTYVSSPLNSKYVFENFVVGNSNQLAYAASVAVAEAPGTAYNPLFLYGNVGLGKTHLMHSIAHHILDTNPSAKVVYASSETFLNELVDAIKEKKTDAFRSKYRKVDALLIDDIQFIAAKEGTQVEFFHTFNAIWELNKQIIISSDRPPKEIAVLEDRLRSRFASGLVADIQPPDFETRIAILKRKAEIEGITMPEDVFKFTAKTMSSSIRELEGALTTINAYAQLTNAQITVDFAKIALRDMIVNSEKQDLSIEYIQNTVADYFGISPEDLKGKRRSKNIVYPRHIAMYFCRKLLDCPLSDIGASFGGRDHSTVINGYDNVINGLEKNNNQTLIKNISDIEAILKKD